MEKPNLMYSCIHCKNYESEPKKRFDHLDGPIYICGKCGSETGYFELEGNKASDSFNYGTSLLEQEYKNGKITAEELKQKIKLLLSEPYAI